MRGFLVPLFGRGERSGGVSQGFGGLSNPGSSRRGRRRQRLLMAPAVITCLGRVFYYGASSSGSSEIPGQTACGSPGALDQPPPSPSHPAARRPRDALPALAKFRDFYSSPLRGINKRASVCSPLSPSPGGKGTWGSAADGSGYFSGCRKSGLSWQARSEVWMGENKWSVIGFSFPVWERCCCFLFPLLKRQQAQGRESLPLSLLCTFKYK